MDRKKSFETIEQKATRVIFKATKNGREGLVKRLTKPNLTAMNQLLEQEARFHRSQESETKILIDDTLQPLLPAEFIHHPTQWIEQQPATSSTLGQPTKGKIKDIYHERHNADLHRVKKITFTNNNGESQTIISKRINPKWEDRHEIENLQKAAELGFPVPKILGEIYDQGNLYFWTEFIPSRPMGDLYQFFSADNTDQILKILPPEERPAYKARFTELNNQIKIFNHRHEILRSLYNQYQYQLTEIHLERLHDERDCAKQFIDILTEQLNEETIESLKQINVDPKAFVASNLLTAIETYQSRQIIGAIISQQKVPYSEIDKLTKSYCLYIASHIQESFPGHYSFHNAHLYRIDICLGGWPSHDVINEIQGRFQVEKIEVKAEDAHKAVGLEKYSDLNHILIRWNEAENIPALKPNGTLDYYFIDWEKDESLA